MIVNWTGLLGLMAWLAVLAFFFAKVEIHIEGRNGWAANLPTWRIEKHWLLDVFWGGRPMTGYHAWLFPFLFLVAHWGFFITGVWSVRLEVRALASGATFLMLEDFLWFVCNPHFGFRSFRKGRVPWHPRWFCGMPVEHWIFGVGGGAVIAATFIRSAPAPH